MTFVFAEMIDEVLDAALQPVKPDLQRAGKD
jgi:hypothetical protein